MPMSIHNKNQIDYHGSSTHHEWQHNNTHHDFHAKSKTTILEIIVALIIIAIIVIALVMEG